MNRKQRRAAARKNKAGATAISTLRAGRDDIGRARALYLSRTPGAGGDEARAIVRRALRRDPGRLSEALVLAVDLGKGEGAEDAMNIFRDIVDLYSEDAESLAKTGLALFHLGRLNEAEAALSRALEIDPLMPEACNNLGNLYLITGRPDAAVVHLKNAIAGQPEIVEPYVNLCVVLKNLADWDQAKTYADRALALPDYSPRFSCNLRQIYRSICDFEGLGKLGDAWQDCEHIDIENLTAVFLDYLVYADDSKSIGRLRDLIGRWAGHVEKQAARTPLPARAERPSGAKLRLGILSSDLCGSSVARFLTPLLRNYDRERLEIYCYTPYRKPADPIQLLYSESVDKFTFVEGLAERELAAQIQQDGVDILLELNGFTKINRLMTVAYKPAPVQMSWYGYPFTYGLKAVDYCIMDQFVVPPDEGLMVEEPIVMPGSWLCFGAFSDVEITEGLPADRNGAITFGTLNNPYKFTPEMIALWAQVMNRVANSRFLLVRAQASSQCLRRNLADEFAKHGVSADRLSFFDNSGENKNHLSYYNDIDISLDTFPLTGGTTTCEATWMGVPVVTLVGESFHQRLSYTMLMNCGLEEFCTFTAEDFVDRAVELAGDRDRLLAWRHGLRRVMRSSALCDEERFLFEFQEMLEQVAELHGLRSVGQAASVIQGMPA
jgi:predicted O-linked N-acetylglucosamine transferase (SPINDLY family)